MTSKRKMWIKYGKSHSMYVKYVTEQRECTNSECARHSYTHPLLECKLQNVETRGRFAHYVKQRQRSCSNGKGDPADPPPPGLPVMSVDAAKVKVAKNLAPRRLTLPLLRGRCLAPSAFRPARDREALVTRKLKGFVPAPRREEATRTISGGPQITEETNFFPHK